jgi:hypothetical protein
MINTWIRRRSRAAAVSAVAVAFTALGITGCGSSSCASSGAGPNGGAPSGAGTSSGTSVRSAGGGSGAAGTSGRTSAGGQAKAQAAIKSAFAKFFAPDTPEKVSLSLLQNGPAFKAALDKQASGSMASGATVKVSTVKVVSPHTAKVTFTIYVNKKPMLKNQPGYAVKNDGTWQVSDYTFCGLLTLEGTAPAACKKASATTVPK